MKIFISKKTRDLGKGIPLRDDEAEDSANDGLDFPSTTYKEFENQFLKLRMLASLPAASIKHKTMEEPLSNLLTITFKNESVSLQGHIKTEHDLHYPEFNADYITSHKHQLVLPVTITSVKQTSSSHEQSSSDLKLDYIFLSNEPLRNFRLCRNHIASLKENSSPLTKIMFVHDFCVMAWYFLTRLCVCWENLDDVILADTEDGKMHFLPLRCYTFKYVPTETQTDPNFLSLLQENESRLNEVFNEKYIAYFTRLIYDLFEITQEKIISEKLNKAESQNTIYVGVISLCRSLINQKVTSKTLEFIWSTLYNIFLQESQAGQKVFKPKEKKHKAKTEKVKEALLCLEKYKYCVVLDLSKIADNVLQRFKSDVKKNGIGEYFFFTVKTLIKEVLPHTNQFKDLRSQKIRNTELMSTFKECKGNIAFFFNNRGVYSIKTLIEGYETRRPLNKQVNEKVKETIRIPAEEISINDSVRIQSIFANLGLEPRPEMRKHHLLVSKSDLIIEKGTSITWTHLTFFQELCYKNPKMKYPLVRKMRILRILEDGYLLPMEILTHLENPNDVLETSFKQAYNQMLSIANEISYEIMDVNRIIEAQAKTGDGLRAVLSVYLKIPRYGSKRLNEIIGLQKSDKGLADIETEAMVGLFDEVEESEIYTREAIARPFDDYITQVGLGDY